MSRRPLFSTFSQGENRVTGSMIAVFERLDLETLRTVLAAACGDAEMQLVRFELQPRSKAGPSVPDARISGSFDYLFETKTTFDAISSPNQVLKHLKAFSGRPEVDERLFVVTPDAVVPAAVSQIKDSRVVWFSFKTLDQAILDVLHDENTPEEERLVLRTDERALLREFHAFLSEERLLGREDTIIVAAGWAYGFYQDTGTYVCQSGRFRPGRTHLGFYRSKQIEQEIPRIEYQEDGVLFTRAEAAKRRRSNSDHQRQIAELIERGLSQGTHVDGATHQVFLLSPLGSPDTVVLQQAITHDRPGPWLRQHRYVYLEILREAQTTDDLR